MLRQLNSQACISVAERLECSALSLVSLGDVVAQAPCLTQEFETLLRFSGVGKSEAVRGLPAGVDQPGVAAAAQKVSDDIRLRYSASSAVTNGLEECMEEAEHEEGFSVSEVLEGAVLTILREIGEDPDRQVRTLIAIAVQHDLPCPVCMACSAMAACLSS